MNPRKPSPLSMSARMQPSTAHIGPPPVDVPARPSGGKSSPSAAGVVLPRITPPASTSSRTNSPSESVQKRTVWMTPRAPAESLPTPISQVSGPSSGEQSSADEGVRFWNDGLAATFSRGQHDPAAQLYFMDEMCNKIQVMNGEHDEKEDKKEATNRNIEYQVESRERVTLDMIQRYGSHVVDESENFGIAGTYVALGPAREANAAAVNKKFLPHQPRSKQPPNPAAALGKGQLELCSALGKNAELRIRSRAIELQADQASFELENTQRQMKIAERRIANREEKLRALLKEKLQWQSEIKGLREQVVEEKMRQVDLLRRLETIERETTAQLDAMAQTVRNCEEDNHALRAYLVETKNQLMIQTRRLEEVVKQARDEKERLTGCIIDARDKFREWRENEATALRSQKDQTMNFLKAEYELKVARHQEEKQKLRDKVKDLEVSVRLMQKDRSLSPLELSLRKATILGSKDNGCTTEAELIEAHARIKELEALLEHSQEFQKRQENIIKVSEATISRLIQEREVAALDTLAQQRIPASIAWFGSNFNDESSPISSPGPFSRSFRSSSPRQLAASMRTLRNDLSANLKPESKSLHHNPSPPPKMPVLDQPARPTPPPPRCRNSLCATGWSSSESQAKSMDVVPSHMPVPDEFQLQRSYPEEQPAGQIKLKSEALVEAISSHITQVQDSGLNRIECAIIAEPRLESDCDEFDHQPGIKMEDATAGEVKACDNISAQVPPSPQGLAMGRSELPRLGDIGSDSEQDITLAIVDPCAENPTDSPGLCNVDPSFMTEGCTSADNSTDLRTEANVRDGFGKSELVTNAMNDNCEDTAERKQRASPSTIFLEPVDKNDEGDQTFKYYIAEVRDFGRSSPPLDVWVNASSQGDLPLLCDRELFVDSGMSTSHIACHDRQCDCQRCRESVFDLATRTGGDLHIDKLRCKNMNDGSDPAQSAVAVASHDLVSVSEACNTWKGEVGRMGWARSEIPDDELALCQDSIHEVDKESSASLEFHPRFLRREAEKIVLSVQQQVFLRLSTRSRSLRSSANVADDEKPSIMAHIAGFMASKFVALLVEQSISGITSMLLNSVSKAGSPTESQITPHLDNISDEEAGKAVVGNSIGGDHTIVDASRETRTDGCSDDVNDTSIPTEDATSKGFAGDNGIAWGSYKGSLGINAEIYNVACEVVQKLRVSPPVKLYLGGEVSGGPCIADGAQGTQLIDSINSRIDMNVRPRPAIDEKPTTEMPTGRIVSILAVSVAFASLTRAVAVVSSLSTLTSDAEADVVNLDVGKSCDASINIVKMTPNDGITNRLEESEHQDSAIHDATEAMAVSSTNEFNVSSLNELHLLATFETEEAEPIDFCAAGLELEKLEKDTSERLTYDGWLAENDRGTHVTSGTMAQNNGTRLHNCMMYSDANGDISSPPVDIVEDVLQAIIDAISPDVIPVKQEAGSPQVEVVFAECDIGKFSSSSVINTNGSYSMSTCGHRHGCLQSTASVDHGLGLTPYISLGLLSIESSGEHMSDVVGKPSYPCLSVDCSPDPSRRNSSERISRLLPTPISPDDGLVSDRRALVHCIATIEVANLIDRSIKHQTRQLIDDRWNPIYTTDIAPVDAVMCSHECLTLYSVVQEPEITAAVVADSSPFILPNQATSGPKIVTLGALSESAREETAKCIDNVIRSLAAVANHFQLDGLRTLPDEPIISAVDTPMLVSSEQLPFMEGSISDLSERPTVHHAQICDETIRQSAVQIKDIDSTKFGSVEIVSLCEGAAISDAVISLKTDVVGFALSPHSLSKSCIEEVLPDPYLQQLTLNDGVEASLDDCFVDNSEDRGDPKSIDSRPDLTLSAESSSTVQESKADSWHELLDPIPFLGLPRLNAERSSVPTAKSPVMSSTDLSRYASATVREMIRDPTLMAYDVKHEQNQPFALLDEKILMIDQHARHMQHDENDKARMSVVSELPSSRHTAAIEGVLVTKRKKMENEAHRKSIAYRIIPAFNYEPVLIKFQWSDFVVATPIRLMSSGSQLNLLATLSDGIISGAGGRAKTDTKAASDHAKKPQALISPIQKMTLLVKKGVRLPCGTYVIISVFNRPLEDGNENLRIQIYDSERVEEFQYDFHEDHLRDYVEDWKGADDEARAFFARLEFRREQGSIIIKMPERIRMCPTAPDSENESESAEPKISTPTPMAQLLTNLATTQPLELPPEPHYRLSPNAPASPQRQAVTEHHQAQSFSSIPRIEEDSESRASSVPEK